jgi:uncharacterized membrane protein
VLAVGPVRIGTTIAAVAVVTVAARFSARPVPGVGIVAPIWVSPLAAAACALLLAPQAPAPVAYVSGTLGTLVGADLLLLGRIRRLGAPLVSIGGAGTFDGIFLTGILAVLLA